MLNPSSKCQANESHSRKSSGGSGSQFPGVIPRKSSGGSSGSGHSSVYSFEKAVLLLLRLKRAFKKRKSKSNAYAKNGGQSNGEGTKRKTPLLRAKTLPAITFITTQKDDSKKSDSLSNKSESASPSKNSSEHQLVASKEKNLSRRTSSPFQTEKGSKNKQRQGSNKTSKNNGTSQKTRLLSSPEVYCADTVSIQSPSHSLKSRGDSCTRLNKKCNSNSSGNSALSKFARLWLQKDRNANNKRTVPVICVALDGQGLRKATSIESIVDEYLDFQSTSASEYSCTPSPERSLTSRSSIDSTRCYRDSLTPPTPSFLLASPSVQTLENKRPGSSSSQHLQLTSSPSMPSKLYRGWKRSSVDLFGDTQQLTKSEKKKLERSQKCAADVQALFNAVESKQMEKVRKMLDGAVDIDIFRVNGDGFTPLDVAVMTNSLPIVKLLQSRGARAVNTFGNKENRLAQLTSLIDESERRIEELSPLMNLQLTNSNNNHQTENDKSLSFWEKRLKLLQEMWAGAQRMRIPEEPLNVHIEVINSSTVKVKIEEPDDQDNGAIVTKYKIQWTTYGNFNVICGEEEVLDLRKLEYNITGLVPGDRNYFRAACGNDVGYGSYTVATPASVLPSIWRDVEGNKPRSTGKLSTLEELFCQVRNTRTAHASEIKEISPDPQPSVQRKTQVKKSIKSLFAGAPKFQKNLNRGVYLACLLYTEDKILVSTEENIPAVEVDETYPSTVHTDILWMMKVACTWDDVKNMRQDMEKSHSSPTVHFKSKLLTAACQMQSALGLQDLGQFYYRPLRDSNGTIVLCTVRYIRDPKLLNAVAVKWVPLTKVQRKLSMFTTSSDTLSDQVIYLADILTSSIQDQLLYHQVSRIPLAKGLYLGYLKLKSSMDQIRLLVPHKTPNVLPHCRMRDNPHVSSEEWEWLQLLQSVGNKTIPSEAQLHFEQNIFTTAKRLFNHLGVDHDSALLHRIYTVEIIELSPDVTFILVLPSVEHVCSVPGNDDDLSSRPEFIMLPVQIFEIAHMSTYNNEFLTRYARLSSILDIDLLIAQHANREAFSSDEVNETKTRLTKLQDFQSQVDSIWKGMRWIMDVLAYARDKQINGGLCFNILYRRHQLLHPSRAALIGHVRTHDTPPKPASTRSDLNIMESFVDQQKFSLPSIQISSCPRNVSESSLCSISDPMLLSQQHAQIRKSNSVGSNFCMPDCSSSGERSRKSSVSSCDSRMSSDSHQSEIEDDMGLVMKSNDSSSSRETFSDYQPSVSSNRGSVQSLASSGCGEYSQNDVFMGPRSNSNVSLPLQPSIGQKRSCSRDKVFRVKSKSTDSPDGESFVFKRPHSALSDQSNISSSSSKDTPVPDILRVYVAYNSGLPSGTSVKLHITPLTTAREVVNLVVKQLNMAVVMKGKPGPIYSSQQLSNFCLVSVLGARERCLRDDFRPLHLQNPWTSGKLYVRLKTDVLAAIQQNGSSGKASAFI